MYLCHGRETGIRNLSVIPVAHDYIGQKDEKGDKKGRHGERKGGRNGGKERLKRKRR